MEYTIGLALEDFVPVILSITGIYFISTLIGRIDAQMGLMARVGMVFAAIGGFSKAGWKLIIASTGNDIVWMDNSLMIFLAPGFTMLAYAFWAATRKQAGNPVKGSIWLRVAIVVGIFYALAIYMATQGGRVWFFVLLGLTTIMTSAFLLMLMRHSWRREYRQGTVLFGINLFLVFMLAGMARIEPQTIPLQWGEQITNTFSQGAFAFAAYQLNQVMASEKSPEAEGAIGLEGA